MVPIGTLAATWLLRFAVGQDWQWWHSGESIEGMGQAIPLGAAIYGSIISIFEGVVRMFWALGQIAKDIDQWRSEGREQGRAEGREQGREEGREEGRELARKEREAGREEGRQEIIKLLADRNIDLPEGFPTEANGHSGEPAQC